MKRKIFYCMFAVTFFTTVRGSEFQVNNRTSQSQANAAIAARHNGGFIVAWSSYYGTSGRSNDIFCRIFEPNCSPAGDEFQINQITTGNQTKPSIAVSPSDQFIVTWQGPGTVEEEGDDIFAQWMDANALPLGDELQINNINVKGDQVCPKIAMNDSGAFVVVWESDSSGADPNTTMICCRRYNADGIPIGDEFQVNTEPDSKYPNVAIDPNDNFTIVWMDGKNQNYTIKARLYDSHGISLTEPFAVSTININSFSQPAIVMGDAGCFLITWDGDTKLASQDDVHARLYEPNGVPKGEQFVVNATLEKAQQNPQAAINEAGQFVIVWDSEGDPNVNQKDIFGQRFNTNGERIGDEFRLNSYTDSDQKCPAVAIIKDGRFITVWQSQNQDGSNYGIYGESGNIIAAADFNLDGYINFPDYSIMASEWYKEEPSDIINLCEDNTIDEFDVYAFCKSWLSPSLE